VLADGITYSVREGSGRVPFAKSQDGQFAVLPTVLALLPCEVLWGMVNMQEPGASILRVGHWFAEGAVNTLVVSLNTKLYDIASWYPVISEPFHFASLPED
jgi:hypothetical protein